MIASAGNLCPIKHSNTLSMRQNLSQEVAVVSCLTSNKKYGVDLYNLASMLGVDRATPLRTL